ncbi:MAG: major capsid protein [Arizlama microvirus]|nr:MAG: major capsid protein [Arizlama microvirus]
MSLSRRSPMVDASHFAMVPRADIPRSVFQATHSVKTTLDADYLYPIYCEEILPGDSFKVKATLFARLATLIFPLMDAVELSSFFFFVPTRLLWSNWQRFMGEQVEPGASTSFSIPQVTFNTGAPTVGSLADYFGLPVTRLDGSVVGAYGCSALPFRAYYLIWNTWFRDENLQNTAAFSMGDGPDSVLGTLSSLLKRAKRHDYFTSALPFAQKGTAAAIGIGGMAPVTGLGIAPAIGGVVAGGVGTYLESDNVARAYAEYVQSDFPTPMMPNNQAIGIKVDPTTKQPLVFANLSTATTVTINALRQAFQIQKLLERDARGGTRYTELLRAHFGVVSPDARLQRPEYLGGGTSNIDVTAVAQTSVTAATPQGNLAGVGHGVAQHGFSKSFVEHGYVLGLVNLRGGISYQQGLRRMWSRLTRYDFYWPAFAHLGEQAVLTKELYCTGNPVIDNSVFGYQERWAEYRYMRSAITGKFRSNVTGTLDGWHLAESFAAQPVLNATFIQSTTPMARVLAAGAGAAGQQFLFDSFFETRMVRAMPVYSVPGYVDHF